MKQTVETSLQQAQRMGAPRAVAVCQSVNGVLEFQAEHWSESEAALRESVALSRQLGAAFGEAIACERLGNLLRARGRLDESATILEEGLMAAERGKSRSHALARLYGALARNRLVAGDLAAAAEALSQGLYKSEEHGPCGTCATVLLPVAVSVRLAQGDLAAAEAYCRQLDEEVERFGSHTWRALACKARGELAAAYDDLKTAVKHFERAYKGFLAAGNEYEAARCQEIIDHLTVE